MPVSKDNMRLIDEGFRKYAREVFEKEWDKTKVMDIVELLRVQEQKGVFDLPDDHKFVGWGEAADEIDRLRGEIWEIWEMLESFPSILEVTNTGNMPTDKDHVDAMRRWNKGVKKRILKANASWLREKALGENGDAKD